MALPWSFAFQPIVDITDRSVFAYEALVRGAAGEGAATVFGALDRAALHSFDRDARCEAVRLAAGLGLQTSLSLNFLPQSLDVLSDAVTSTLDVALECGLSPHQLILEITESEIIHNPGRFARQINSFKSSGLRLAIDDFGSGYAGLNLLAEFQPDIVKIDMTLVRDIDSKGPRQAIARALIQVCRDLGLEVIAEGVETESEVRWFKRCGVELFQGYYFARPAFQRLEDPKFTRDTSTRRADSL
jgi:EAL domain-containing protein (putative c-di-GMP-specific phosphodiesterase class I)